MKQALKENKVIIFILFALLIEAILFSSGNFKIEEGIRVEERSYKKLENELENLDITAKAVSVKNLSTGRKIYGKEDNAPMPLASLVKTMTALVALNHYESDDVITLKAEAIKQNGDFGLFANEKWKVGDLIKLTLISSANDGAFMFALDNENLLGEMNSKAKRIGMENTIFHNVTGLDVISDDVNSLPQAGAFGSAEDMNTLAHFALMSNPEVFQATTKPTLELKSESGFLHKVLNTNVIIDRIPNILFSKTGFTEIAGGNLSVVFKNKNGEDIAVTILGSTINDRFSDMEKIVNVLYSFSYGNTE